MSIDWDRPGPEIDRRAGEGLRSAWDSWADASDRFEDGLECATRKTWMDDDEYDGWRKQALEEDDWRHDPDNVDDRDD